MAEVGGSGGESVPCQAWTSVQDPPALTTIYTPAPSCSNAFVFDPDHQPTNNPRVYFDQFNPIFYDCLPKEYDVASCNALWFSPGWCPQGWTAMDSVINGPKTTATCCQSGFKASRGTGEENLYINCLKDTSDVIAPVVTPGATFYDTAGAPSTTIADVTADHRGWIVTWDASDLSLFVTAETGAPENNDKGDGSSPSGADQGDTSGVQDSKGSGLGAGAIAGIVVGIVAVLALAGAAFFFVRRRKGQRKPVSHELYGQGGPSPSAWREKMGFSGVSPASRVSELESASKPVEVPVDGEVVAEVEGNTRATRTEMDGDARLPQQATAAAATGKPANTGSVTTAAATTTTQGSNPSVIQETSRDWVDLLEEERRLDEQRKKVELEYLEREMQRARERRLRLEGSSTQT